MLYDLALDNKTHDIAINQYDGLLIGNAERVAQQMKIVLLEWLGEWFLDSRDGIDYLGYILVKNPNMSHIKSILTTALLAVDGVASIDSMTFDWDRSNRQLAVTYAATTDYGLVTDRGILSYGD